ncbi:MAG: hypothetical protein COA84_13205 [Robiginitomaculum sp.]|nr:MAG: hypothetical protein COA84_13205 [Robiginitomaculum sp.]
MATNSSFNNFASSAEQTLIEDLVIESIRIYGHNVYYLPRTLNAVDDLLNEDDLSSFNSAYLIEMYIKNVEGFEGEGDFLSKFGLQIRDSITFTVANKVFNTLIEIPTGIFRPNEGDMIYFPLNGKMFKLMHVEHESIFYQVGALQMFDLRCELFEYSQEVFNTGVTVIDTLFDQYDFTSNTAIANLDSVDAFSDNEIIQTEADIILDFTEKDPYSEGGTF